MKIGHNSALLQAAVYSGILPADTQLSLTDSCPNPVSGILEPGSVEGSGICVKQHQTASIPAALPPPVCRHGASAPLKALSVLQGSSKPTESDFQLLRGPLMHPLPAETTAFLFLGCLLRHTTSWEYWKRFLKILEFSQKYILMGLKPTRGSILK